MTTGTRHRLHQDPAPDGLRGVAILLVLAHHFFTLDDPHGRASRLVAAVVHSGWVGVDLFFVLSGFLITNILLNTRGQPGYFRTFYLRRTLRIFPLYYAVAGAGLVVALSGHVPAHLGLPADPAAFRPVLLYYTNFAVLRTDAAVFGAFFIFWSLAVEEHFYLVWPTVLRVLRPRWHVAACVAVIVAAAAVRAGCWAGHVRPIAIYAMTCCRMDALAAGGLLAIGVRAAGPARHRAVRRAGWAVAALAGAALVGLDLATPGVGLDNFGRAVQTVGYPLTAALMSGVLAVAVAGSWVRVPLRLGVLRWYGRYSYGIYVLHPFVQMWVNYHLDAATLARHLHPAGLAAVVRPAAGVAVASALGWASYHGFERHFLRLKDAWAPKTASAVGVGPPELGTPA